MNTQTEQSTVIPLGARVRVRRESILAPDDQFSVVFDAVAPDETGLQVMTWVIEGQICFPYIAIIVH